MKFRFLLFLAAAALAFAAASCKSSKAPSEESQPGPAAPIAQSDGSMLETNDAPDGTKVEARVFPGGELSRATRLTRKSGDRFILVEFRDNRTAVVREQSLIEGFLEADSSALIAAAKRVWETTGTQPPAGGSAVTAPDATTSGRPRR